MPSYLGLDVGTSSTKAVLVDEDGTVLGQGSSAYATHRSAAGVAEQDPADYSRAAAHAIAQCGPDIRRTAGVGLVGQIPTLVLCDDTGRATRPAMTWQDHRAVLEAGLLVAALGDPCDHIGTSLPWSPTGLPAKLAWLAKHEPDILRASKYALQPKDFLGNGANGLGISDPWSSKGLCNVETGEPCVELLAIASADPALVPRVAPAWSVRGEVTAPARFGLPAGIPVTAGWSDALAGMLAIGAFEKPATFALSGTSDIVGITMCDGPRSAKPLYSVPASCAPMVVVYGPTSTSGAALIWLADLLGSSPAELLTLAADMDVDREIPVFVPYLDGERAPIWRHDVAATLSGLRHGTTRADLAQAVLAGVACSERHVVETALSVTARAPRRCWSAGWPAAPGPDPGRPCAAGPVPPCGRSAVSTRWRRPRPGSPDRR